MTEDERKAAEAKWAGKFAVLGGLKRFCDAQKPVDNERVDPRQYEERAGRIVDGRVPSSAPGGYRDLYGKRYHP
jgi:hypothetical protein